MAVQRSDRRHRRSLPALEIPITGGNVSFYNETLGKPIYPTPVLGVLGLLEDAERALGSGFRNEGDVILLLDGAGKWSSGKCEDSRGQRRGRPIDACSQ